MLYFFHMTTYLKKWLIMGIFLLVSIVYFFLTTPRALLTHSLTPFYKDPTIATSVHDAIITSHNPKTALFARLFHNKPFFTLNNIFISFARSVDPVVLYGLSPNSYFAEHYQKPILPSWLFPIFIISSITLIRKWASVEKNYFFLILFLIFSLVIASFFLVEENPLRLFPLFLTLQGITIIGMYEFFLIILPWLKKLFSFSS